MNIDAFLSRLEKVRGRNGKWKACCPAHEDREPSLSIAQHPDGRVLLHCFAGCSTVDVLAAVGMSMKDLMPEKIADYLPGAYAKREKSTQEEHDEILLWQVREAMKRRERISEETARLARAAAERIRRKGGAHA